MTIKYLFSKLIKKSKLASIKNSKIHASSKIEPGTLFVNSCMDKHSFCGYDNEIIDSQIGSFCSIGNNVKIGGGEHPYNWVSTSPVFYNGRDSVRAKFSEFDRNPVQTSTIGNDVWIGQNSLVKQGITIGHGAIIGMGSVVTKDVEPYAIVAGVPAKKIKYRFSEKIVKDLLDSKWWNLDDKTLKEVAKDIKNPEKFLEELKKQTKKD